MECVNCKIDKLERSFHKGSKTCKKCVKLLEKEKINKEDLFDTDEQRKMWLKFYGDQKISLKMGLDKGDSIRFIPRKKTNINV